MEYRRKVLLALAPKFSASLSMFGSLFVIFSLWGKSVKACHITLIALSIFDVIGSFGWFLSTWPIPKSIEDEVIFNVGNSATCNAQAFIVQLSLSVPIYNLVLVSIYASVIIFHVKEDILSRNLKYYVALPPLFPLATAIAALERNYYGFAGLWCWIEEGHKKFQWAFYFGPLWFCFIFQSILMLWIFVSIRKVENNLLKYQSQAHKYSKKVLTEAMLYSLAFMFCWSLKTLFILNGIDSVNFTDPYDLLEFVVATLPLQGFLNFLICLRKIDVVKQSWSMFVSKLSLPTTVIDDGNIVEDDKVPREGSP